MCQRRSYSVVPIKYQPPICNYNRAKCCKRTTRSATGRVHKALRLKLHGAPASFKDRAGCFDITPFAIVAQNSIVSDTHQSWRQDMQAKAPDKLQGGEG